MNKHKLFLENNSSLEIGSDSSQQNISEDIDEINDSSQTALEQKNLESDSDDIKDEFFKPYGNGKLPYTFEEDEIILRFILKGQNIFKTTSISLWKQLEAKKGKPFRTYQSLKNRFLRNIRPKIFLKFTHLIQDKEVTKKILSKFPELKRTLLQKQSLQFLSSKTIGTYPSFAAMGNRPLTDDEALTENISHMMNDSTDLESQPSNLKKEQRNHQQHNFNLELDENMSEQRFLHIVHFPGHSKNNSKYVEHGPNKITVTFRNDLAGQVNEYKRLTIYEKYLALKSKNLLTKCQHCGRGEPDSDPEVEENLKSGSESENAATPNPIDIEIKPEPLSSPSSASESFSDTPSGCQKRKSAEAPSPNKNISSVTDNEKSPSKPLNGEKRPTRSSKRRCTHIEDSIQTEETHAWRTGKLKEKSSGDNNGDGDGRHNDNSEDMEVLFQNFIKCGKRLIMTDSEDENNDEDLEPVENSAGTNQSSAIVEGQGEKKSPISNEKTCLLPRENSLLRNILDMLPPAAQANVLESHL